VAISTEMAKKRRKLFANKATPVAVFVDGRELVTALPGKLNNRQPNLTGF
jgi:hypothetical protein